MDNLNNEFLERSGKISDLCKLYNKLHELLCILNFRKINEKINMEVVL